jgi:hypothetical protein
MFTIRTFWRWQTQGNFMLASNAIMNWGLLDVGADSSRRPSAIRFQGILFVAAVAAATINIKESVMKLDSFRLRNVFALVLFAGAFATLALAHNKLVKSGARCRRNAEHLACARRDLVRREA